MIQCAGSKGRTNFAVRGVWKQELIGLQLFCDDSTTQATPFFVDGTRCAHIETPKGGSENFHLEIFWRALTPFLERKD